MKRSKLQSALWMAVAMVSLGGSPSARAEANVSNLAARSEARNQLIAYVEGTTDSPEAQVKHVRELLKAYRFTGGSHLRMEDAPYARFLIASQLSEIYPALYASARAEYHLNSPYETTLDKFMQMILDGTVPLELRSAAKKIGPRIARNVLRGASPGCKLDPSDTIRKVSTVKLLRMKLDRFNWISACAYRKAIYNEAKPQLIKLKKNFPETFREQFLEQVGDLVSTFPDLVAKKFGAEKAAPLVSILDPLDVTPMNNGREKVRLFSLARGMRADLAAARVLLKSSASEDRALAGALFYAVTNRMLYMTGGEAGVLAKKGKDFVLAVDESKTKAAVAANAVAAPVLATERFGGWGVSSVANSPVFSAWDWGGYDPAQGIRLFPSNFSIDEHGIAQAAGAPTQLADDLGETLLAMGDFLVATGEGGAFGKYFGGKDQIGDLLEEDKPFLFPSDGRLLPIGIIAAIGKNLLADGYGHIELTNTRLHVAFYDFVTFAGRDPKEVPTSGVSKILLAAYRLNPLLNTNAAVPEELKAIAPELQKLLQIGALAIGASMDANGVISRRMVEATTNAEFHFETQVLGLRALEAAYAETPDPVFVHAFRLSNGWKALMQPERLQGLSAGQRMRLQVLWSEGERFRRDAANLPWSEWQQNIATQ